MFHLRFLLPLFSISLSVFASYTIIEDDATTQILSPALKERKTIKIRLENGIEAYLVSDPGIDQSAAGVCMDAGSWQDPDAYPGMAHFLEHMLFMGSSPYPNEEEYMRYIEDNGGKINAFTAPDRTVYMFSVNNSAYIGALHRFSRFFIDPLFNPSCIARELHAVDQEHSKNIENDSWREYMVLKETSNPAHPITKFSTGNAQTLSGIPQSALKTWYESHYSANSLHLVLLSSLPLDAMISLAVEDFSPVANRHISKAPAAYGAMLQNQQKGHFIYIQPVKDLRTISLTWELPQKFSALKEKWTEELVCYILNEASEHSLIRQLRQEQIAESIQANTDRLGKDSVFFQISIQLTEKGLSQLDTVILRCFQTLARLKQSGIPLTLFQEMKTLATLSYQYQSREDAFSWITQMAYSMPDEDLSTFPEQTTIPTEFNPESVEEFLSYLTPGNATYFILADPSKLGIQMTSVEKWSQVPYAVKPIPPAKLTTWEHATPYLDMGIVSPNPFVPKSLDLVSNDLSLDDVIPTLLINDDKMQLYFATDHRYQVPESAFSFMIHTPSLDGSARSFALADLLCKALYDQLSSTLFFAEQAGLQVSFGAQDMGFYLSTSGFSEKAPELTLKLLSAFKDVRVDEASFLLYKDSLLNAYSNTMQELPVKQAFKTLSNVLLNDAPTPQERLKALQDVSFESLKEFASHWLDSIYLQAVLYGNMTEEDAKNYLKELDACISSCSIYLDPKKQKVLLLPEDKGPFKIVQKTDRQGNGFVLTIQQGAFTPDKKATQTILSPALQEMFYSTLRTKQQVGYITYSWASQIDEQLFENFAIQSSSNPPEDLLNRTELFLEDFTKRLNEIIPPERFSHLKNMQITSLKMPPENLQRMGSNLALLAFTQQGNFRLLQEEIQALELLTYEEFLQQARSLLSAKNSRRLAILVEGVCQNPPFIYKTLSKEDLSTHKLED